MVNHSTGGANMWLLEKGLRGKSSRASLGFPGQVLGICGKEGKTLPGEEPASSGVEHPGYLG